MKIRAFLCLWAMVLWISPGVSAQGGPAPLSEGGDQAAPASARDILERPEDAAARGTNGISLEIKNMDVVEVLQMLAKRASMNVAIGKDVSGRVTLFLKNVDARDVFEIVLLSNGLASAKKGDIVNVMTQASYEAAYGSRFQDERRVSFVRTQYARAVDLAGPLRQIQSKNGRIVVDQGSNTLVLIDSEDRLSAMEEFVRKADLPLETKFFDLNYVQAAKLKDTIEPMITKEAGSFQIDERTNKLIVKDYPEKLREIERVVQELDEKTPQVLIDAQIVEINPNKDQFAMGVDWDYWLQKNMRFSGALPAPSLTDVGTIPNKFSFGVAAAQASVASPERYESALDMLRVIGKTKVLSSPRLMVLNNQEAKILVGTKEAYITSTVTQNSGSAVTSQSVNFVDVGIKLYVTPTVNRDGFITMKIRPEISSSKRTDITSEGQVTQIPIVTTSESETTIMVKNNATIIIAGLKKDRKEKEVKKIPLLGDIPLLGFFFRNTRDEAIQTELVIFITPRIVTGEENIPYDSLTQDKDIERIQKTSADHK